MFQELVLFEIVGDLPSYGLLQELVLFEIKVVSRATAHLELRFAQEYGDGSFVSYGLAQENLLRLNAILKLQLQL